MAQFHLGSDPVSCQDFLDDQLNIVSSGVDTMTVNIERLKRVIQVGASTISVAMILILIHKNYNFLEFDWSINLCILY